LRVTHSHGNTPSRSQNNRPESIITPLSIDVKIRLKMLGCGP
jgi:hypothetical protein